MGLLVRLAGVLLFGLAVGAGSLLVAGSALAELALFRVEQSWHVFPNPPVTTPGGAGLFQWYIEPYTTRTPMGENYIYPPATAIVASGNPTGGAFTLPTKFISLIGTYTLFANTGWPGYTTFSYVSSYNGPGKFGPNHGATGPTRIVFPTTMGNPYPTYNGTLMKWTGGNSGDGSPVTPTTTFDGRYDLSRGGSINVTPGPRRFGGTLRMFHGPDAGFYQYIYKLNPAIYKAYGDYRCLDEGKFDCTPSTFASDIGDTTAIYQFTRFLLNVTGTGTGDRLQANTAKATTATGKGGYPTVDGQGTPNGAPASYLTGMQRYLNLIHPWTTGFAKVHNAKGSPAKRAPGGGTISPAPITPQAQGYDISLGGADITVTRYDWMQVWNPSYSTLSTYTATAKQYLHGVGRVVSMVRPRLIHTYRVPVNPSVDPITNTRQLARLWRLKVFFLPEPTEPPEVDNCLEATNEAQDDTDTDDCGNLCDADYDNNGMVSFADFLQFAGAFGGTDEEKCHVEPIPGCTVGFSDFLFFAGAFGGPPGPSGTTAGTIACP
jgi:hypothetical protein